jgi:hypothetical protein
MFTPRQPASSYLAALHLSASSAFILLVAKSNPLAKLIRYSSLRRKYSLYGPKLGAMKIEAEVVQVDAKILARKPQ